MSAATLYGGWGSRLILRPLAEAHRFMPEADGLPAGEGWMRRMDLSHVRASYPVGMDVRRIGLMIGDERWQGQGIGGEALRFSGFAQIPQPKAAESVLSA